MININKHCCQLMSDFIEDQSVPLKYNPKFRAYSLDLRLQPASQGILYCPWCGKKLPERLGDKYFEILKKEYNIGDPFGKEQATLVPEEFKSDEWWKKRGL